jgi:hypothetical protein
MQINPGLEKLGYSSTDCKAIVQTDDIGMCLTSVAAFIEIWNLG